ncbi:(2Fe-2S)-binding protein [Actinoplanes sp. OR16]|uniref:(2Fe-2S)-binding protein n=1 Tax=Actinoplanes sp. OR16 TaxID=946334 RepID=UPI001E3634BB|nr:(2Fe-2S)-binding protein [Actinoplanes sp. OR16]
MSDARILEGRVAAATRVLQRLGASAGLEERVVASTVFLGLAARLVSPPLGAAVIGGAVPVADPARMRWQAVESGPIPIVYDDLGASEADDVTAIVDVITTLVAPILDGFRTRFVLSPQVLWGNVASALGGAHTMIAKAVPEHAARSAFLLESLLAREPLAGMATLHHPADGHWFLVRRNCCLYYRIPGGGTCGDCVLVPAEDRRRQWQAILGR